MEPNNDFVDSQSISLADLGIQQSPNTRPSIFGMRRSAQSLSRLEWAFLSFSFVSALVSLGFNIYRLVTLSPKEDDFIFGLVVLINIAFVLLYAVDGVFREQYFEIWAVLISTLLLFGYVVLNYVSGHNRADAIKLARLCVSAALAPPVFISGALLSRHYMQEGFLVFRTVGARQDLQSACHLLYQAQTLLAFDAQGMASLLTLVLSGGAVKPSLEEMCTLIVGGILTGLWLMLGYLAMRYESRQATILFLFLGLGQLAFITWRFYQTPLEFDTSSVLYKCAFFSGATTVLVNLALSITTILVYNNYGKGLRQKVYEEIPGRNTASRQQQQR